MTSFLRDRFALVGRLSTHANQSLAIDRWGLVLLSLFAVLPCIPSIQALPKRDSSVFMFAGRLILEGKAPYVDVWDHKGPLLYLVNALGVGLGQGGFWGIWAQQAVVLLVAAAIAYRLLHEAFGQTPARIASVAWLLATTALMEGGNLTEVYTLPFQFSALLIFWRLTRSDVQPLSLAVPGTALGALGIAAFMFRANNAGTLLLVTVTLAIGLLRRSGVNHTLRFIGYLMAGAAAVTVPIMAYLASKGAVQEWWQQAILFNIEYSGVEIGQRLLSLVRLVATVTPAVFSILVIQTAVLAAAEFIRKDTHGLPYRPLLGVIVVDFAFETLLVSLTGRAYNHYYLLLLPSITLLIGWHVSIVLHNFPVLAGNSGRRVFTGVAVTSLFLMFARPVLTTFAEAQADTLTAEALGSIRAQAEDNGSLLVWGASTVVNVATGIPASTRYVYQYPLYYGGPRGEAASAELVADLRRARPLIVDTSATNANVPPLAPALRQRWLADPGRSIHVVTGQYQLQSMEDLFEYIAAHYSATEALDNGWVIYRPSPERP